MRVFAGSLVVLSVLTAGPAAAQSGDGSLRGYVKDEQGGVLPAVTVTGTSPALLAPVVAVTDSDGYYRLNNLPPGAFEIKSELARFATYRRDGIVMRAGLTFSVDIDMKVGALTETITVSGESPMIETRFRKRRPIPCSGPVKSGLRAGRRSRTRWPPSGASPMAPAVRPRF
jgi:Carboxypeptidase regulatory-like domain